MHDKPSTEDLGRLLKVFGNLLRLVEVGTRPIGSAIGYMQAAADGKPYPLPLSPEFDPLTTDSGLSPIELQVARFRLWNDMERLRFTSEEIHAALLESPALDAQSGDTAAVLCWSRGSLSDTVFSYLRVLRRVYGFQDVVLPDGITSQELFPTSPDMKSTKWWDSGDSNDRYPDVPGRLWWELVDLTAYPNAGVLSVDTPLVAGLPVLAVACHHQAYIRALDGVALNVSGLRYVNDESMCQVMGTLYRHVPVIRMCSQGHLHIELDDERCEEDHGATFSPVLVK